MSRYKCEIEKQICPDQIRRRQISETLRHFERNFLYYDGLEAV